AIYQSTGCWPDAFKKSFALEKGLLPKKPRYAESGLGCTDLIILCFVLSMSFSLSCAALPQSRYTMGSSFSFRLRITWFVKFSQPIFRWECALPFSTVSTVFTKRTTCLAQSTKRPWFGRVTPSSFASSMNIFFNEGGGGTPGCTEKLNPCAWFGPWQGSWPKITTFTS